MKIKIKNRFTKTVIYTAEIKSADNKPAAWLKGQAAVMALTSGADLRGASLRGADLSDAYLRGADLRGADLSDAYLRGAILRDTILCGADLRGADLRDADLRDADLSGAILRGADLSAIRADFLNEVAKLPDELEFLRDALTQGKVNGSSYAGECACLAGTLAHARGIKDYGGESIGKFRAKAKSPRERFFLAIRKGDTPENSQPCRIARDWTNEAIAARDKARAQMTQP